MTSIHRRLLAGLLVGLTALVAVSSGLLYFSTRAALTRQFDAAVAAKAQAVSSLIKLLADGEAEIEFSAEAMPAFGPGGRQDYFQVWRADGSVLSRSPSLGKDDLPLITGDGYPVFDDVSLPGQRPGRAIAVRVIPAADEDEEHADRQPRLGAGKAVRQAVHVVVAQDRSDLDRTVALMLSAILGVAALMTAGTLAIVTLVVRRGLRPLQRVAEEAARIDARSLGFRFSVDRLPSELRPICLRLNESLSRLEDAFRRERRFTADVAHELRTPIAELRSLADVALRWQGDAETSLAYFKDAREIARQMESVVTTLLAIARCQSGGVVIEARRVVLHEVVDEAWACFEAAAAEKGLKVTRDVASPLALQSDRTLVLSIVTNLLSNAVQYTPVGRAVALSAKSNGAAMKLTVTNDCEGLAASDLAQLFEAFWRKDAARTDGSHCGLGLTLVAAYAEILGGSVKATMPQMHSLCIEVELPCY